MAPSSMTGAHGVMPVFIDKAELELSGTGEGGDRVGGTGLGGEEEEEEEMVDELEVDAGMEVGDGMGMGVGVGGVGVNKAVTTTIEWRGGGEKVYVTGTFVNWERKFRLHKRCVFFFSLSFYLSIYQRTIIITNRFYTAKRKMVSRQRRSNYAREPTT